MPSKSILTLTAALLVASSAVASAFQPQIAFQPDHKKGAVKAGIVTSAGTIAAGTGYAVSHDGTGKYTIDVPSGQFKTCPAILVTPAGVNGHAPIPDAYDYISCGGNAEVKFQVRIYARTDGTLEDNSFHFALIGT